MAIYAEGKEHAMAIGYTKMSTQQVWARTPALRCASSNHFNPNNTFCGSRTESLEDLCTKQSAP